MSKEIHDLIQHLVNYNWRDEERDYQEMDEPTGHIFEGLQKIQEWLDKQGS
jgi:hypothetical protein